TRHGVEPWMAYIGDRLITRANDCDTGTFPREQLAEHIFSSTPGWTATIEYEGDDPRFPESIREHNRSKAIDSLIVAPLLSGGRTLGWRTASNQKTTEHEGRWWRVVLIEAIARQAALALHHSRLIEQNRVEERRKAILEERHPCAAAALSAVAGQRAAAGGDEPRYGHRRRARPSDRGAAVGRHPAPQRRQRPGHRHRAQAPRRHAPAHRRRPP